MGAVEEQDASDVVGLVPDLQVDDVAPEGHRPCGVVSKKYLYYDVVLVLQGNAADEVQEVLDHPFYGEADHPCGSP